MKFIDILKEDGVPNERELEIEKVKKKTETIYKALKKGTLIAHFEHGQPDVKFKYELPHEYKLKVLGSMKEGFKAYIKLACNEIKIELLGDSEQSTFGTGWGPIHHKFESFDISLSCL